MKREGKVFHLLGYGLYVLGSKGGEKYNAQIVNAFMQVTSKPPRVAFALNKGNLTHDFVKESRVFSLSIVSEEAPLDFIGKFGFRSGREGDKFLGVNHKFAKNGCPVVLDYTLGYLAGKVIGELDVGTHTLFVGEVEEGEILGEGVPLTYSNYQKIKKGVTPKRAPTFIETKSEEVKGMKRYVCSVCGYVYDPEEGDPEHGIAPGTAFEDLPEDWVCPVCGASKDQFEPEA